MARRVSCRWIACVLVLASTGWHGAIAQTCFGAGGPTDSDEGEEALPDMNFPKSQAEVGRAKSQTQQADFYLASSDFTNAEAPANPAHALTVPAVLQINFPPVTAVQKNAIRVSRVDTLAVTDVMPQEVRPFGGPPSVSP